RRAAAVRGDAAPARCRRRRGDRPGRI
ncbi:MAG: hypothetical protein AVDCRST_MAG79-1375, partial [uncultured Thermoleophilia bacterium]